MIVSESQENGWWCRLCFPRLLQFFRSSKENLEEKTRHARRDRKGAAADSIIIRSGGAIVAARTKADLRNEKWS